MRFPVRLFLVLLVLFSFNFISMHYSNVLMEKVAPNHPSAVRVWHTLQFIDFVNTGGGPFGAVENVFAREHTLGVLSEDRTLVQRLMFPRWLTFQPLGYWVPPEKRFHHPALALR
jgi:hypothetical protein